MTDGPIPVDPPGPSAQDFQAAVGKGLISLVPFVGGALAELFEFVISPILQARRDDWFRMMAERLNKLAEQGRFTPEQFVNDEAFATAMLTATQAALRTHHKEKREALRNAVLNVALGSSVDEQLQSMFIAMVDRFTPWHLLVLSLFRNPTANPNVAQSIRGMSMGGKSHVLEAAYPQFRGQRGLYDPVVRELHAMGLLNTESLHTTMSAGGLAQAITTELGGKFVDFISAPAGLD